MAWHDKAWLHLAISNRNKGTVKMSKCLLRVLSSGEHTSSKVNYITVLSDRHSGLKKKKKNQTINLTLRSKRSLF